MPLGLAKGEFLTPFLADTRRCEVLTAFQEGQDVGSAQGFWCVSDRSFRKAATTSTIAALVACASLRSYSTDVCVAPSTTRWHAVGREGGQIVLQLEPIGLLCTGADHSQGFVAQAPQAARLAGGLGAGTKL